MKNTGRRKVLLAVFAIFTVGLFVWIVAMLINDPGLRFMRSTGRVEEIALASKEYFKDYGKWPTNVESLVRHARWSSLKTNDAWGHDIKYFPFDSARGYGMVVTFGADGKSGGEAKNADGFACYGVTNSDLNVVELQEWATNDELNTSKGVAH